MLVAELVATSDAVAQTASRNAKVELLAEFLKRLEPIEVPIAVAWLSGHLRQGRIGLGWSAIHAAARSTPEPETPQTLSLFGDSEPESTAGSALTLPVADAEFQRLAAISGSGAARERGRRLRALLQRASESEKQFLSHLILGEIRQGALEGIMEEAVARAGDISIAEVRRATMLSGDLEAVAVAALTQGRDGLAPFKLQLFNPVLPMLAQPVDDLAAAMTRLGTAILEHKLDGARIQVHRQGFKVRVYTRQLNDVTAAVPEVAEAIQRLPLEDAILDGEAIALAQDGRPQPFQVTMRRFGASRDVESKRRELPLSVFLFDLLRLDGRDLLDTPLQERSRLLRETAPQLAVKQRITDSADEANRFLDESLAAGHEGLMAKDPSSTYQAGGRGNAWLKIKLAHTLDLVVLAVERGSGRRREWLSNIHLGARDQEHGGFVMLGKTFKGMTDEILRWQTTTFPALAERTEGHVMYLRPEIVVEIDFNDVQESPRYPGGMALRLARVRRYRPDKSPGEADTVDTVRAILEGQRPRRR